MLRFVVRRVLHMIPTLLAISVVSFVIIQLPPGDFLTTQLAAMEQQGQSLDPGLQEALRERYALDQPVLAQYWMWITNIVVHGDFGQSFQYRQPVRLLIGDRLPLTLVLGIATLVLTWTLALPAGIYSAVKKGTYADYCISFLGFLGLAIPNFLIALIFAYLGFEYFQQSVGGLFSPEYVNASWNIGKVLDLWGHLWIPVVVIAAAGTAGIIRVMRANLSDELRKPYVVTARAKGLTERKLIARYPVRIALNPFISTSGWHLPSLFDGEVVVAQVLGLATMGPLLLGALKSQDMYLAGGIILIIAVLTVLGTLLSDILLAVVDPRIRLGKG
jgi:peptide/nickel transport system permease protein